MREAIIRHTFECGIIVEQHPANNTWRVRMPNGIYKNVRNQKIAMAVARRYIKAIGEKDRHQSEIARVTDEDLAR